ncbi:MAG: cation diffusion facilitator family transporter, partial [Desulfobulbus sp.]|nr:cation diffusion facilitator family transporter [Desulfobulbus sp.]
MHINQNIISDRSSLTRFAWLSIAAAITTILMKMVAYLLTGSVGLLSDAVESVVNLAGALMALSMLTLAAQPADAKHTFGHSKAEYFSSVVEGILILVAASGIVYTAIERMIHPRPLEQVGIGILVCAAASVVNFVVARVLMKAAKAHNSITLEADSQHLMTDVWTSAGVIVGVGLIAVTGWTLIDPIVALLVAVNIVWTGIGLIRRSVDGLMDVVLPVEDQQSIEKIMIKYRGKGVEFHELRTRQSASHRFITVHMLVPGGWTVHDAHHVAEDFEGDIRIVLSDTFITTHLEPIDDNIAYHDI